MLVYTVPTVLRAAGLLRLWRAKHASCLQGNSIGTIFGNGNSLDKFIHMLCSVYSCTEKLLTVALRSYEFQAQQGLC